MNELEITAKVALANTFVMYFKAHSFHWNVEGKNFAEMHGFFGDFYDEVYGAVDTMAEEIRACGYYAPRSLNELYNYKTVVDINQATNVNEMLMDLVQANATTLESLNKLFDTLTTAKKQGFANFIADRIDAHEKHGWMLRSFLKGE
jgi:starvation-inducible DNA-binding protein